MTINEDRRAFYATALGHSGQLSDLENEWLKTQVLTNNQISTPDLWKRYLNGLGYSGTNQEMRKKLAYPLSDPT